jgi:hypothetical protein
MTEGVERLLARLPEPTPPPTLEATVMARIARLPDRAGTAMPMRRRVATRGEPSAWILSVVGLLVVVGLTVHGWLAGGVLPDVTSARIGFGRQSVMAIEGWSMLLLGLGLWLFLAGLFAPLRSKGRR